MVWSLKLCGCFSGAATCTATAAYSTITSPGGWAPLIFGGVTGGLFLIAAGIIDARLGRLERMVMAGAERSGGSKPTETATPGG